jgi:hypothetical protein
VKLGLLTLQDRAHSLDIIRKRLGARIMVFRCRGVQRRFLAGKLCLLQEALARGVLLFGVGRGGDANRREGVSKFCRRVSLLAE